MEDRVLRTNQIINRKQDYQSSKLGSPKDNYILRKENWNQVDEKNKNQFKNYELQAQNVDQKNHYQSYKFIGNRQQDKEQNYNTNQKQSYYYEQSKPYTPSYYQREYKYDQQSHMKTQDKQNFQERIIHSSDKYLQKQNGLPFGNRTPMDSRSNIIAKTPLVKENQNKFNREYQQSDVKNDFKWPEQQRISPEFYSNKINQNEKTNLNDIGQTLEQKSFLDIEKRLQQRREQTEKISGKYDGKLNYHSKSQEYSQRKQKIELDSSLERMKQFQQDLRSEIQDKIREQTNKCKLDSGTLEQNFNKKQLIRDAENKQHKNEILELDQFKYTQLDGKFNVNQIENKDNNYFRQHIEVLRKSKFEEKCPYQRRINIDSKQEQKDLAKYHFNKKQDFYLNQRLDEKKKYIDTSLQQNKSQNEGNIRVDFKSEGSLLKDSKDRLQFKDKLIYEIKQPYMVKRDNDQSQEIQRRQKLSDKLLQFDQWNKKYYQDSQNDQTNQSYNTNLKQEKNNQDLNSIGYNFDTFEIKRQDQKFQQFDKMEFKRPQCQAELNQIKSELEKKYGFLKPEMNHKISEYDNRRALENRFRQDPIQTKIAEAREYLGQKYYQRDLYKQEQRNSYHEESSINDRLGLEKGNFRSNLNNRAIEDILQGKALSKYIEREKNQNRMVDRFGNFINSNVNYQKSPVGNREQKLGYDRLNQQQKGTINDRYIINEYKKRQTSDQNLSKYCSPTSLISKQFGNYDIKQRRI
ncbi:unnamed protein product [Paramecium sonneborni]|uniref:Uncharacterized protein n=1 Tax=Paramecium sonneborni TaxID=65129 RepID=A0A8S1PC59_9CILI|nr:unnamed protein product [Paramecium sonneborni]